MRTRSLLLALAATLAGCATPDTDTSAGAPPAAARPAHLVHSIQQGEANVFEPVSLTLRPGTKVTWDIVGEGHHTVDFLDAIDEAGTRPVSGDLGPGQTFEVTFTRPGTFGYYCKYHSNKQTGMVGTIVVE